jgi:hypothetical protein
MEWLKNRKWSQYTNNIDAMRLSLAMPYGHAQTIEENGEENL